MILLKKVLIALSIGLASGILVFFIKPYAPGYAVKSEDFTEYHASQLTFHTKKGATPGTLETPEGERYNVSQYASGTIRSGHNQFVVENKTEEVVSFRSIRAFLEERNEVRRQNRKLVAIVAGIATFLICFPFGILFERKVELLRDKPTRT